MKRRGSFITPEGPQKDGMDFRGTGETACLRASGFPQTVGDSNPRTMAGRRNEWQLLQRLEVAATDLLVDIRQQLQASATFREVAGDFLVPHLAIGLDQPHKEGFAVVIF